MNKRGLSKILIVENDATWKEIIKENLIGDFQFDEASDVDMIKQYVQFTSYNLIISDLIFSDVDERVNIFDVDVKKIHDNISKLIFALKQTKRDRRRQPPIIIVTAYKIEPSIPIILNDHVGWIWGWHVKDNFDLTTFHRNVEDALLHNREYLERDGTEDTESKVSTVLFLAADPSDLSRLRVGEEFQKIQKGLQSAQLPQYFKLELPQLSIQPEDFSQALLNSQPQIVHFSGHGTRGGLYFQDQNGESHQVDHEALAALFKQFSKQIKCVILNACYSELQAISIADHIEFVIGMSQEISDKAAIAFTIGFYQALGAGCTFEVSYELGCVQIRLMGIPEHLTPVFIKNE